MRFVKGEGSYTRKATSTAPEQEVSFAYDFPVLEQGDVSIELMSDDVRKLMSDKKLAPLSILNQTLKEDCANNSREATKRANGDSTERILSPEEKETRKSQAKADRELLKALKSQGIRLEDIASLLK